MKVAIIGTGRMGSPERRAIPIAGDDLAEGRRFLPGTPIFGARLDAAALRRALEMAAVVA